MNCDDAATLIHAHLDNELDAEHSRALEAHLATCERCSAELASFRSLRGALADPALRHAAPVALRERIARAVPALRAPALPAPAPSRRSFLRGFAAGGVLSGAIAASLVMVVLRGGREQQIIGDVVSAHLRSLQADHLTDVLSTDQHTVKPWFNGRLDVAPPVVDLTAQGFTLIGGRLDYIDGRATAVLVYRRRTHVINLFVAQNLGGDHASRLETVQGFNIRRWREGDLSFFAISDIESDELQEFGAKFEAGAKTAGM